MPRQASVSHFGEASVAFSQHVSTQHEETLLRARTIRLFKKNIRDLRVIRQFNGDIVDRGTQVGESDINCTHVRSVGRASFF